MLTPHPTWQIFDASKTTCYRACPRQFFYSYILGWRPNYPDLNLVFGEGWHRMKELAMLMRRDEQPIQSIIPLAYSTMANLYREHYSVEATWSENAPKNPAYAESALLSYLQEYKNDRFTVLETEVSGEVPVSEENSVTFRLDLVAIEDEKVKIFDHKSSGSANPIYSKVMKSSNQMLLYSHAAHCLYGDDFDELIIDLTVFQKTKTTHSRIPMRASTNILGDWILEINETINDIKEETLNLSQMSEGMASLPLFKRRRNHCTAFFKLCPFYDFCIPWSNPLQRAHRPPAGFVQEFWDPRREEPKKEGEKE